MDFNRLLQLEEEFIEKMCSEIIAVKPDLVITEKGVSGNTLPPSLCVCVSILKVIVLLIPY